MEHSHEEFSSTPTKVFQQAIHILAYGVIGFSVVEVYLTLNKLWSRKHIKEVADSISISARTVGMIPRVNIYP